MNKISDTIKYDAYSIRMELYQYGAFESNGVVRTIDTDYYFKMATLKRVVSLAKDIILTIKNAIE